MSISHIRFFISLTLIFKNAFHTTLHTSSHTSLFTYLTPKLGTYIRADHHETFFFTSRWCNPCGCMRRMSPS